MIWGRLEGPRGAKSKASKVLLLGAHGDFSMIEEANLKKPR